MSIISNNRFDWATFYIEFADKLLLYKNNRADLLTIIKAAHEQAGLKCQFANFTDIDPFTVFGAFNKSITNANRMALLKALAEQMDIKSIQPINFGGIPVLMNMMAIVAWNTEDFSDVWELFDSAINYADNPIESNRNSFIKWYDTVTKHKGISWNITMGLYWTRPYSYLNLDGTNRSFLLNGNNTRSIGIEKISKLKRVPDAETYLNLIEVCLKSFSDSNTVFHSFPELSNAAWDIIASNENEQYKKERRNKPTDIEMADRETPEKHFWLYAPGEQARFWNEFYDKGIMGIGWEELGDLNSYSDKEAIRKKMKEIYGQTKSYTNNALATWQFTHAIREGDIVFAKKGLYEIIGRGIVESDYIYLPERKEYKNIRKIKWTHKGNWAHPGQAVSKTLTDITNYTDYVEKLELLITGNDVLNEFELEDEIIYEKYFDDDFLNEVFIEPEQYEILVSLLKNKKNLILQGAPGVGKTFAAKRLAYSIIGVKDTSRVMTVQFHQSYSYEDFIMGFRPTKDGFELAKGPFYTFCKDAQDDLERDYFFIIDEINRGNLSKIFGELLMLIENDKRGEKLRLLYSNELFFVPKNVHIIGLMNTADRSLAMIDYALRRRFAFYEMEPAFDSPGFLTIIERSNHNKFASLIERVKELNEIISKDESLGDGFRIGHSYFCNENEITDYWLSSVINFEILPLLNEYWFDEKTKIESWAKKLRGVLND